MIKVEELIISTILLIKVCLGKSRHLTTACTRRPISLPLIINGRRARVMPSVRLLGRCGPFANLIRAHGGWRRREVEVWQAVMCGLTSKPAGSGRHGAG